MTISDRGVFALFIAAVLIVTLWRHHPNEMPGFDSRQYLALLFEIGAFVFAGAYVAWRGNVFIGLAVIIATFMTWFPTFDGYGSLHKFTMAAIVYATAVQVLNRDRIPKLFNIICIIGIANAIMVMLQSLGIDPYVSLRAYLPSDGSIDRTVPVGLTTNRNEASALIAFCIPAFLRPRWWWLLPVPIAGLVLTRSMGGLFAISIAAVIILPASLHFTLKHWAILIGVIAVSITILLTAFDPKSPVDAVTERIGRFHRPAVRYWLAEGPIWGVGYGRQAMPPWSTHNDVLHWAVQTGIPGVLVVCGFVTQAAAAWWRQRRSLLLPSLAFATILINAQVNFPFHIAPTAVVCLLWLVIFEHQRRYWRQRDAYLRILKRVEERNQRAI